MSEHMGFFHHISMTVPDLDVAEEFYKSGIGLSEVYRKSWSDSARMDAILDVPNSAGRVLFLSDGRMGFEFFEFTKPVLPQSAEAPSATRLGWMHVCLRVPDIHAACERLQRHGMTFKAPPSLGPTGNYAVYGRDPFGNFIELVQLAASEA